METKSILLKKEQKNSGRNKDQDFKWSRKYLFTFDWEPRKAVLRKTDEEGKTFDRKSEMSWTLSKKLL